MQSENDFLQNFKACEAVINSPTTSCDEKCAAWRMQNLLLSHLTRNHNQTMQCTAQRKQMQKLDLTTQTEFVQQRAKTVDSLLSGFTPKLQETMDLTDNDDSDTLNYEASCCGAYESCRYWEMKESHLKEHQQQRNALLNDDDDTLIVQAVSNFNESIKEQKAKPSEEKIARNTLTSYLQRIPSQSTTSNSKMGGNKEQINQQRVATASGSNCDFRTALEVFQSQNMKKYGNSNNPSTDSSSSSSAANTPLFNYGATKKTLGARRTMRSDFVSPLIAKTPPPTDERLKNIDPKMVELITNEIMHKLKPVDWTDIAGLDYAKSVIKEAVVYPLLRPDIFTGLRRPPRGILLFGPPGTGKTLIGKCIASDSQSTFFSISASSLTSKWVGDGEKMVRALFAVAAVHQPSVIFIDEIDSILSQRSETEHESSRRLKTEFLIQLDGATTSEDDRILIVGATNRPQELDEAARRRLVRRLYIPLPELEARIQILMNLLNSVRNSLVHNEIHEIGKLTVGYSGADMESLCREASMEPIRSIPAAEIRIFKEDKVRPICMQDFIAALNTVRPSVSQDDLQQYTKWNLIYGAGK